MTIEELKELSPFLAVLVSIIAVAVGPFLSGKIARKESLATMREKWIYTFRDTLVELITELELESYAFNDDSIFADEEGEQLYKRLLAKTVRIRLMVNTGEDVYLKLTDRLDLFLTSLRDGSFASKESGAKDLEDLLKEIKELSAEAIRLEWKKVSP
ncbi:hypothetical protein OPW41_11970 [Vibrio europaeus]|uniref:hypothetical protein n=1 Tax=Vibrio europaeus TaxID=300876 RepID=UPI00233F11DA|nr:hypothetical protein [Vibrio europaeus]MDC5758317.1 hypothetical protein [Vibrio europaeus]MDC5776593.1 hypothetical protein [Vibrio europaeus]MDC5795548.1 hypothetical protein [Vibrio europaeus]MDC5801491.1 hypothetical protein [Vibrio europaeus]MDC5813241.1 hypothetical protein [Vibrio europaeus]